MHRIEHRALTTLALGAVLALLAWQTPAAAGPRIERFARASSASPTADSSVSR